MSSGCLRPELGAAQFSSVSSGFCPFPRTESPAQHVNVDAGVAFAVRPRVESLFAFDEQAVAFAGVFSRVFACFPVAVMLYQSVFLISSPVALVRFWLTAIEKLAIKLLLALMRVSGSRPKFPTIVTLADIIFALNFLFFFFSSDDALENFQNRLSPILVFPSCSSRFSTCRFIFVLKSWFFNEWKSDLISEGSTK